MKFALVFLGLTGITTFLMTHTELRFGTIDFWKVRGIFFLFFVTLFPRLTLLFSSILSGGLLWWLAFIFTPRLLVAALATLSYWESNPVLVIFSWLIAISGETGEKSILKTRVHVARSRKRPFTRRESDTHVEEEIIEAEFKEIK